MRERGVEVAACCDWTLAFTRLTSGRGRYVWSIRRLADYSLAHLLAHLLACLLASSCLCGLQAAGLPIEDCGVSMASWLLPCAALRCNIGLQQSEPMQCTHAKVSRGGSRTPRRWQHGMPVGPLSPDTLAVGCYSMQLHAIPTAAPLPGASGALVWTKHTFRLQLNRSTMSQRLYCCPRIPRARRP